MSDIFTAALTELFQSCRCATEAALSDIFTAALTELFQPCQCATEAASSDSFTAALICLDGFPGKRTLTLVPVERV